MSRSRRKLRSRICRLASKNRYVWDLALVRKQLTVYQIEELGKTCEALVGAETSRKYLDERVQELTRQLQGNEEKLAVYEKRPATGSTTRPRSTDESLIREQQLEAEVAELR